MEISPNNDFYQYVNSEWLNNKENQIPDDYSSWGGFTKLHDDCLNKQIEMVKSLSKKTENEEHKKIANIWEACKNRFREWSENKINYTALQKEFNEYDKCFISINNQVDYIKSMAKYLHYSHINGIPNVLDFDCGSNLKNVNNVVLELSTSGLSLPSKEYYESDNFSEKLKLFENHINNVRDILKNELNLGDNFSKNVILFESNIAKYFMTPDQSREYDKYYTNTTLENLYKNINDLKSLERKQENYNKKEKNYRVNDSMMENIAIFFEDLYKHFDFKNILSKNFDKNLINNNLNEKYHITVFDGDGIRRCLDLLLDMKNYEIFKSYIQYQIIKQNQGYCSEELNDEFFDFYSRKLGGQKEQKSNDKRSISIVNKFGGEMVGKLFVENYFSDESKLEMQKLVDNILEIMHISLKDNDWLTNQTKQKSLLKLKSFTSKIGYPNKWEDYSDLNIEEGDSLYDISKKSRKWKLRIDFFDKINSVLNLDKWLIGAHEVNAYFMPTQNEIVFPAAILQPPFFHKSNDTIDFDYEDELKMVKDLDIITPANYGAIGAVIAHEITHGYDDKGRKFDESGNINDWWSDEDTDLFLKKTNIMKKSVSKYLYKDLENNKEFKMNVELTMGENLADIGGLSLSKQALLKKLKDENASNINIKASLRIFFKSWANIWKQNIKKDRRIMLLNVDPHAPTDFRGNLVQHMDEFYEVFEIKQGDKMFLDKKFRMKMW